MQKVIKYLLYFIITIKVLFILSIIRYRLNEKVISNKKVAKKIMNNIPIEIEINTNKLTVVF